MMKGTQIHQLLQGSYNFYIAEGSSIRPLTNEEINGIKGPVEKQYMEYQDLVTYWDAYKIWSRYLTWSAKKDKFVPLRTEVELFVPTGIIKQGKPVFLHGIIDLIAELAGELGVVDHKSYNSEKAKWTPELVNFDLQLAMYMVMMWMLGHPVEWGCINGINSFPYKNLSTEPDSKLFNREFTHKDVRQLRGYQQNIFALIDEMFDAKFYPKRLKKDCKYCGYREVCDMEIRGLDSSRVLETRHGRMDIDLSETEIDLENLVESE